MARDRERSLRALNRFGMGAAPGQVDTVPSPESWLEEQLEEPREASGRTGEPPDLEQVASAIGDLRRAQRSRDREGIAAARRRIRQVSLSESRAALTQRVVSSRPFIERLVSFWSNHLCVSGASKIAVAALAGSYERDVIRRHVLGRFEDMVLASARHPAMLLYLDNAQSIGPTSPAARQASRRGRPRGLNENYARELLELHTVGVDGGYTQADVGNLAKILTGWTVGGLPGPQQRREDPSEALTFRFIPMLHEPGPKRVMGRAYDGGGMAEGEDVIRDLCRRPATAVFVATKLVRHFVDDQPRGDDVSRVANVFQRSQGDLREVAREIVRLESAWHPANRKLRSPQDWLVAALRALEARHIPLVLVIALRGLRQPWWSPQAPKGYDDTRQAWADPDGLLNRAELARSISTRFARGIQDPVRLLEVVPADHASALAVLLEDESIDAAERVALALAGPDFQWR